MTVQETVQNYTLGRGALFFEPFLPGTTTPSGGERFFGDCNAIDFTFKTTDIDHYSSLAGVKELDFSVPLQVDRSGTFTTENISPDNLALFFLGISSPITVVGGTITAEVVAGPITGDRYYQLGETASNPSGNRDLDPGTPAVIKDSTSAITYVVNTDYIIDYVGGSLYVVPGGAIDETPPTSLHATYTTLSRTHDHVISGSTPALGKLRFRSANPNGANRDCVVPQVRINPSGSFALIGDKLQALQFEMKLIKKNGAGGEAIYIDGVGHS